MTTEKSSITVAIIGGGLGGVCTAITLGKAGYDVHVFEQAASFGEVGAGIALGPNSVKVMQTMGILDDYAKVADLSAENAVWFHFRGADDSKKIGEARASGRASSVHRARALEALVKLIPKNVTMHFRSHIAYAENIESPSNSDGSSSVRLHIAASDTPTHPEWPSEHTTFDCAFAIGCDGIKSAVRGHLGLGGTEKGSGGRVRYTGTYAYRGLLDTTKAVEINGKVAEEPTMWFSKDKHILVFPIEGGKVLSLVAFVSDRSKDPDEREWNGRWVKPVPKEKMLGDFAGWDEKPVNLLKLIEKPEQWALHELTPLDQWTVGRITLLGDAAHASLPHNGAGAGQAIEDAFVLGELLKMSECTSATVPSFLRAYEDVRRERAARQQLHSRESGEIYEFKSPMGGDYDALGSHLKTRYNWIWEHDLTKDVETAKSKLRTEGVLKGQ